MKEQWKRQIEEGEAVLGIEFGSTRIKAILIGKEHSPIAQGAFDWENRNIDGVWTYALDDVWRGLQACYADLKKNVLETYGVKLTTLKALGISAMMHGYLASDGNGRLLVPFRTWRNTITKEAADKLSDLFGYPIPERWSVAHLFRAILLDEEHVTKVAKLQTLAGCVHERLTGRNVDGIGDASGMFPIDIGTKSYDERMLALFDREAKAHGFEKPLVSLLPKILLAGEEAGCLTEEGALLLDPTGETKAGIPLCPPEGDAGTGMVATDSIKARTGNVSAGTSVFAMVVLEKNLSRSYPNKIDLVTTPDGKLVAMSHANNCTGEYDHWMKLFAEVLSSMGVEVKKGKLYDTLLMKALEGDRDCGGLLPYNYISGESMTDVPDGRPLFVRSSHSSFTLANFMRAQLFTALGALRSGMDILFDDEGVRVDTLKGHGGFFKTAEVGKTMMAAALHTPISVLTAAGEGGAWGIALLASYLVEKKGRSLEEFLDGDVFADSKAEKTTAKEEDIEGFNAFFKAYKAGLPIEREAAKHLP